MISSKWLQLKNVHVKLFYAFKDKQKCILSCDDDVRTMIDLVDAYGIKSVDVVVLEDGVIGSSSSYVYGRNLGDTPYHNDGIDVITPCLSRNTQHSAINLGWDKLIVMEGQRFEGGALDFRLCLLKQAIQTGFEFVYKKNDAKRITAVCAHKDKCDWIVHAVRIPSNGQFYIKKLRNIHRCGTSARSFKRGRFTSNLVSKEILDTIRDKPMTMPSDIIHSWSTNRKLKISYDVAKGAVKRARDIVYGNESDSFNKLRTYADCILETNPGSVVVLDVDPKTHLFRRIFIAFSACIQGFNFCRPLIYLDGAHLKSTSKGHLLAATAKDGDNGLYPVCFAVVLKEDYENWHWFLEQFKRILTCGRQITFMTDRNIGLLDALPEVFPDAHHSFCIFHLNLNMKSTFSGKKGGADKRDQMVDLLNKCAYASTVEEYHRHMGKMLVVGGKKAEKFFRNLPREKWANAYFEGSRYGNMAITAAESFNSWVRKERHLPVLNMIDAIRIKIMRQLAERRDKCFDWTSKICPKVDAKLYELQDIGRGFNIIPSTGYEYEVLSTPSASVDLECGTCSCNEWQRYGYPCIHGLAVIGTTDYPLYQFVDPGYLTESYANAYHAAIHPIPDSYLQENILDESEILPPIPTRQPGRPPSKRIKSTGEFTRPITCGRCGKAGNHNSRTCTLPSKKK